MLEITDKTFAKEVLQSDIPVLVDFWAPWCGPCKKMAPIIEKIEKKRDKIKFVKINLDTEITFAQEYKIMTLPTFVLFKKGEAVLSVSGLNDEEKMNDFLDDAI